MVSTTSERRYTAAAVICVRRASYHRENIRNIVHDNIHPSELRPELSEDGNMRPPDHVWLDQVEPGHIGILPLKLAKGLDLLDLGDDKGVRLIALGVHQSNDILGLLPPILLGQPARRLGKQEQGKEQEDGRDHLQAPGEPERGG